MVSTSRKKAAIRENNGLHICSVRALLLPVLTLLWPEILHVVVPATHTTIYGSLNQYRRSAVVVTR
jgi:hypothetical protein